MFTQGYFSTPNSCMRIKITFNCCFRFAFPYMVLASMQWISSNHFDFFVIPKLKAGLPDKQAITGT